MRITLLKRTDAESEIERSKAEPLVFCLAFFFRADGLELISLIEITA